MGDGRSAALIDRQGTVSWLAWPRFDSPAQCAAILGEGGGHLRVGPAVPARARRAYLDGTNVLATSFEAAGGTLRLVDFMAIAGEEDLRRLALPEHELVRIAECVDGEVPVLVEADLRPGYGARAARLREGGALGLRLEEGGALTTLRASAPLALGADGVARARAVLREGDALVVSLAYDRDAPAVLPPLAAAREALRRTAREWRRFSGGLSYRGPWRAQVERSALVLKLLSFAPSGAIVAAPTTSLPERPGGALNWDYRFCWLRDAALTVRALYGLGCRREAEAFGDWLLHATRLTRPELRVLYDVYGRPPPRERELPHLAGHGGARPVRDRERRRGPAPARRLRRGRRRGGPGRRARRPAPARGAGDAAGLRRGGARDVARAGERHLGAARGAPPAHALARPRLGRADAAPRAAPPRRAPAPAGRGLRAGAARRSAPSSRRAASARASGRTWRTRTATRWTPRSSSSAGTATPRPARRGWRGPGGGCASGSRPPRASSTAPSGASRDGEGAFGICSFWAAEHLARGGGSLAAAVEWMEALLSRANDLDLFAEEIDAAAGAALGNFPQAFTHVGLVSAALAVEARAHAEARRPEARGEARA